MFRFAEPFDIDKIQKLIDLSSTELQQMISCKGIKTRVRIIDGELVGFVAYTINDHCTEIVSMCGTRVIDYVVTLRSHTYIDVDEYNVSLQLWLQRLTFKAALKNDGGRIHFALCRKEYREKYVT